VLPRGADAVIMIEHTDVEREKLRLIRPLSPGANVTFAGTDMGRGETVLRRGSASVHATPVCWPQSASQKFRRP